MSRALNWYTVAVVMASMILLAIGTVVHVLSQARSRWWEWLILPVWLVASVAVMAFVVAPFVAALLIPALPFFAFVGCWRLIRRRLKRRPCIDPEVAKWLP